MSHRSRTLVDWLLIRAWIEPDHERPLRVLIRRRDSTAADGETEQLFGDAEGAASFLRLWLMGLVRRWEGGERFTPERRWGPDAGQDETEQDRES
jgi:hypothetical protein